ncbi:response regulator transcription factor [Aminipila terrae]|uniref:Stage 0 sporulation protein A homolog n=1 Tax=Aminipila terrae TaxID=2697030 RepID=A0A6P1MC82_9FIRM|nr:response regulator transcription factor [Aminipila terrae]QHI72250.1 response regulator [Aminipila terrae]
MANILAIDDDNEILEIIRNSLKKDNHKVDTLNSLEDIDMKNILTYDLILLDVMMPKADGFTFCKDIRNNVDCPIIFITARTMETDLIEGFAAGADDYIKKPFSLSELRSRVKAHIRRECREYHQRILSEGFRFDISEKQVYLHDNLIRLTKSEYEICEFLIRNKGQVFSLEQILERVFGFNSESDGSAIREHIKNIRAKLSKKGVNPIETVWGIGYKWN